MSPSLLYQNWYHQSSKLFSSRPAKPAHSPGSRKKLTLSLDGLLEKLAYISGIMALVVPYRQFQWVIGVVKRNRQVARSGVRFG